MRSFRSHYKEIKGWKLATPREDFPKGQWWRIFHDAELDRLEETVAVSNQTVKSGRGQLSRRRWR